MERRYISATQMARERGCQTGEIFTKLISQGFINPVEGSKKWELTEKGLNEGGRYNENPNFRDFIEWPEDLVLDGISKQNTVPYTNLTNVASNNQQKADTEGERYIKEFFKEAGIKYDQQVPIRNLSFDEKAHRVADFYLPKYGVYVEFFGHWNTSEEHKEIYRVKKRVYRQNHIPCVFIYPENLGYIDFAFDHRIMETLKENYKERELNRYKKWKLFEGARDNFIGLLLCIIFYVVMAVTKEAGKAILILLFVYNVYKIVSIWNLIYVKGSYSINRMLYD